MSKSLNTSEIFSNTDLLKATKLTAISDYETDFYKPPVVSQKSIDIYADYVGSIERILGKTTENYLTMLREYAKYATKR